MAEALKAGVLISGGGSNLQALIDAAAKPDYPARIAAVIANRSGAGGLTRARKAGIPTEIVDHTDYPSRAAFDSALQEALERYGVEIVCLAGFNRILTPGFVGSWEGRMLNIHPALLPRHGGKGMYGIHVHRAVLEAGDAESGASVHLVTAGCDEGPVILQRKIPVLPEDTPDTLAARVLEQEHIAYPEALAVMAARLRLS